MVQRPSHPTIGSGQRSYNPTHGKHKIPSHLAILIFAMVAAMIRLQSSSFVVAFRSSLSPRRRMFFLPTFVSYSESTQFGKRMCGRRLAMLPTVTPMSSASFQPTTTTYTILFDLLVPEGRCVGLSIADLPDHHPDALHVGNLNGSSSGNGHWIHQCLHPDEVSYGVSAIQSPSHRKSFWLGRLAMRHALSLGSQLQQQPYWSGTSDNSNSNPSILKDEYGRPQVPPGFLGSISHKGTTGVALVAASVPSIATANANLVPRSGVGVDLEYAIDADRRNIARKVLTPNEQANLGRIPVSVLYWYETRSGCGNCSPGALCFLTRVSRKRKKCCCVSA
jgi:4'-phosphopantetheinyl transferase EntD